MTYTFWKPILDRLIAGAALVLISPVLGAIAIAIILLDGRPVLFTQQRAGHHGRPFRIYKFRTLRGEAHDPARPQAHLTRTGRVLRRWALDELPQLWNVLRGDMSLVGPRPTLCEQVEAYGTFERKRLHVKPGLTGWAQIHGRNVLSWPERIELDVWYVKHQSFWVDAKVLLHTPQVLWHGTGVYGSAGTNETFRGHSLSPETKSITE